MKVVPLRLQPGDDLRLALEAWMAKQQEQAGCLNSAVSRLSVAQLRLAGATQAMAIHGELVISPQAPP
jgi:predicted DNA-binding protein with PD1-like motif